MGFARFFCRNIAAYAVYRNLVFVKYLITYILLDEFYVYGFEIGASNLKNAIFSILLRLNYIEVGEDKLIL